MPDVNISINGRVYEIGCDAGQEGRIVDLAAYIDQRLQQIARSGAAYNDAHLTVLTALVLADEVFEARDALKAAGRSMPAAAPVQAPPANNASGVSKEDEIALVRVLDHLTKRIEGIAAKVQSA